MADVLLPGHVSEVMVLELFFAHGFPGARADKSNFAFKGLLFVFLLFTKILVSII